MSACLACRKVRARAFIMAAHVAIVCQRSGIKGRAGTNLNRLPAQLLQLLCGSL